MKIDDLDPLNTFLNLKLKHPEAFFFESSTLSIIGLDHEEVIRLVGPVVLSFKGGLSVEVSDHFLDYLSKKLRDLSLKEASFPYEFGGAFGCLGYEIAGLIEPKLMSSGVFSRLKDSEEVLAEVFISKNLIVFEHAKNTVHLSLSEKDIGPEDFRVKEVLSQLTSPVAESDLSEAQGLMGEELFINKVKTIKDHIKAGDLFQAVLSERFEIPCASSPLKVFELMKRKCLSEYSFYFDFKESSFFGASPETLVKINNLMMETHPIAGTRPRGHNESRDQQLERQLRRSTKESAEHLMLVDLARNDLGRVAEPGTVKVEVFREILKLSHVMHLVSIVKGKKPPQVSDLEALCACFPAGTLSGAPKVRAMEILSQLESRPRGFYGGAIVAFEASGGMDSCIAIRSIEMKKGQAILRAGAGIVADSNPKKEYQEIKHKLKALYGVVKSSAPQESSQVRVLA